MARPSDRLLSDNIQLGLTLDRYQEIFSLDVNAFNGLLASPAVDSFCTAIWGQTHRDRLVKFIIAAEKAREKQLGYFVGEKITYDERHTIPARFNPFLLNWKHLTLVAAPVTTDIEGGTVVSYTSDPVEIIIYTDVDPDEIHVFYPGEDVEILPYSIVKATPVYGAAYVTIKIPWARLIKPDLNDDRDDHLRYSDTTNYLVTVDVKRIYRDETLGAQYIWLKPGCVPDCTMREQAACVRVMGEKAWRLSQVWIEPASYSGGWATKSFAYAEFPDFAQFTYYSGVDDITTQLYTGRLAHALMPFAPCDCTAENMYWNNDKEIVPGMYTAYGSTRAAIDTWMYDSAQRIGGGGKFPRVSMSLAGIGRS